MIRAGRTGARRLTRWSSPAALFVAGLLLLLPFVAVSCEAPGGYGRGAAGSTTTYTGMDLVTGDEPAVSPPDRLLPPEQRRDDTLGVRPLAVAALLLIAVAVVVSIGLVTPTRRRGAATVLAGLAALSIVAEQVTVRSLLTSRLRDQLTAPLPAGKQVGDYVQTQPGFWLCLFVLIAISAANGAGLLHAARRRRPAGGRLPGEDPRRRAGTRAALRWRSRPGWWTAGSASVTPGPILALDHRPSPVTRSARQRSGASHAAGHHRRG